MSFGIEKNEREAGLKYIIQVEMEDPVVPLEWNLYGHVLAGRLWERHFEKALLEHGWKSFYLGMFICQPSKRTILIRVCGRYQTGRQKRKHRTDLDNSHGRR